MRYFILSCLFLSFASSCLYAQNRKAQWSDTLYTSRKEIAMQNSEGFAKVLGLNKEQQNKFEQFEIEFREKTQSIRNSNAYGREKSIAMKSVYDWREKELVKLLSPQQLTVYKQRGDQAQTKVNAKRKTAPSNKAVMLKRK